MVSKLDSKVLEHPTFLGTKWRLKSGFGDDPRTEYEESIIHPVNELPK